MSSINISLSEEQKLERLYNIYISAFDYFKKSGSKKEPNFQKIKDISIQLKDPKNFYNLITNCSLLLVEPFEKCTTKTMEVILASMEEILRNDLVESNLLQKMVEILISYIHKYFQNNEIDFKVDSKILKTCELIYANKSTFIHNDNLKNIIKIYLRIYLSSHHTEQFQVQIQKGLSSLIKKMIDKLMQCQVVNQCYNINNTNLNSSLFNEINDIQYQSIENNDNNNNNNKNKDLTLLLNNDFIFISKKYTDFLIDLIEIQDKLSPSKCDIINKYISIIKNSKNDTDLELIKNEIEALKLNDLDIDYINSEGKPNKIGKYGWCILCRKPANFWSAELNFPVCSSRACANNNFSCNTEFQNCLSNVYPRCDFMNVLIYLTNMSILGQSADDKNAKVQKDCEVSTLCRQFCLEKLKEMIDKTINFFKNDNDVIVIIKEIIRISLSENSFSPKIKIFQLSLETFITIIKGYREHLKEQIEIYLTKVFVSILESENIDFVYKDAVLDALIQLNNDCKFMVEIYVNFDCIVNCNTVFSLIINLLTKIINGLYKKNKYQNTFKPLQENYLVEKTLVFLNNFNYNLNKLVDKNEKLSKLKERTNTNINDKEEQNEILSGPNSNLNSIINNSNSTNINNNTTAQDDISSSNNNNNTNNVSDVKEKINKNIKKKKLLDKAIEVFNFGKSSSQCLKYLKEQKMIFSEEVFIKIKKVYIDDINNNTIKDDYSKLLSPEEQTIISELSTDELSEVDIKKNNNIMQTPFISSINPLVYFIQNEDKEKLPSLTFDDYIAFEMARFIRSNLSHLIRDTVSDYLCKGKPFNIKVLTYFINSFDFSGNNILNAMRILFNELPLSGEAQVIDRVVQIFGEKFHKQNPQELKKPDHCYYLAFLLLQLNTDLHRDEVEKKMTLKEFINSLNSSTGDDRVDPKYLEGLYYQVLTDPLVIPGQKLSGGSKNKKELIEQEKANIRRTAINKLQTIASVTNNYFIDVDNDNIRDLLDLCWSNFFSIYSQLLADNDDRIAMGGVRHMLTMARTCAVLKINIAVEAYLTTLINITGLNDNNRELTNRNVECIKLLIDFIINNGQYIRTGWANLLQIVSKIEYYLVTDAQTIINDIPKKARFKNSDKDINNIILQKKDIICKNIPDIVCDGVFTKTDKFDEDAIINFVTCLCSVSKEELSNYITPRVFSLHKLVEVADFNIFRIQAQWVKIWALISEHLVYVISKSVHENIWREALDSLKQTICKLLQKKDLFIYNFQMDFFKPFETIFSHTENIETRGEMVIYYIYYIVGSYGKYIHSGWIVIFRILKAAFERNAKNINEYIKNILLKIYEDTAIIYNATQEIFSGYIECLCYMYLDKNLKQYAFETILKLLAKIMNDMDNINQNDEENVNNADNNKLPEEEKKTIRSVMMLPNINKKFDFLKIFFYGFDDLIKINVIEHLNLLFEIISHNKNLIFSKDYHSFLYMYYSYFKPHLLVLIFSRYLNRFNLFDTEANKINIDSYSKYKDNNSLETKTDNVLINLIDSLNLLIKDFSSDEGQEYDKMFSNKEKKNENKRALVGFFNGIKEGYSKEEMIVIVKKKILAFQNLNEHDYEMALEFFLEKFNDMYSKISEQEKSFLNYNYFYEDLFLTIHKLILINSSSDLLFRILNKILSSSDNNVNSNKNRPISDKCIDEINSINLFMLNLISNPKIETNEDKLHKLISFCNSFSNFLISFIQVYDKDIIEEYNLLSKTFSKILIIDLSNNFDKYKITNSSSTVDMLIKLQGIQSNIISKVSNEHFNQLYNNFSIDKLINLHKIYQKYKISNDENSMMNGIFQFELENTIPKFKKYFTPDDLKQIFEVLVGFTSSNNLYLRKAAKNLIDEYIKFNMINFNKYDNINKEDNNDEKDKVNDKNDKDIKDK